MCLISIPCICHGSQAVAKIKDTVAGLLKAPPSKCYNYAAYYPSRYPFFYLLLPLVFFENNIWPDGDHSCCFIVTSMLFRSHSLSVKICFLMYHVDSWHENK